MFYWLPVYFCAGFMTTHELKNFESLHSDFNKYWMPLTWFSNLAAQARQEGRVRDDIALRLLMDVSGSSPLTGTTNKTQTTSCTTHFCFYMWIFAFSGFLKVIQSFSLDLDRFFHTKTVQAAATLWKCLCIIVII